MPRIRIQAFYRQLYKKLQEYHNNVETANFEFRWLLLHSKTVSQNLKNKGVDFSRGLGIFKKAVLPISFYQQSWLSRAVRQRVKFDKPFQYILGTQPFNKLQILVRKPVLIPRWETEEWSTRVGCLVANGISKEDYTSNSPFRILDLSDSLNHNVSKLPIDLIVSNPPYVSHSEYQSVENQVKNWEDKRALVPMYQDHQISHCVQDVDGSSMLMKILCLFEKLVASSQISNKNTSLTVPKLVLELGNSTQAQKLKRYTESSSVLNRFRSEIWNDLAGNVRNFVLY
ncbi:hypothetical protein BB560_000211 [Smittium megazygosporum]|uniref:Uncharacterized protein n=1 Tax=Smittium megazygosporum TaxID=133381 RepID=A0A2T9ZKZ5_9FUNG|nr:hypothetical protein BB560_000211 [Smittium megazygosporum]